MTIVGNVVDTPKLRRTRSGHSVANFRVASTPRRFDREAGQWVDGQTLFVTVTCWRSLGENAAQSLCKGQPIVVVGRYCQREYERDETLRTAYELEAIALGHDLTRGVAQFEKVFRPSMSAEVATDEQGIPEDESAHYLDLDPDAAAIAGEFDSGLAAVVDPVTGEVHELTPAG
jgi:single-strand DNA-binding protein